METDFNNIEIISPEKPKKEKVLSQLQIDHLKKMRQKKALKSEAKKYLKENNLLPPDEQMGYKKKTNNIEPLDNSIDIKEKKIEQPEKQHNLINDDLKNKIDSIYNYIENKKTKPIKDTSKIDEIHEFVKEKKIKQKVKDEYMKKIEHEEENEYRSYRNNMINAIKRR